MERNTAPSLDPDLWSEDNLPWADDAYPWQDDDEVYGINMTRHDTPGD